MSRASSAYVSPNLGPTTPWGNQTSTGVFRPPQTMPLTRDPKMCSELMDSTMHSLSDRYAVASSPVLDGASSGLSPSPAVIPIADSPVPMLGHPLYSPYLDPSLQLPSSTATLDAAAAHLCSRSPIILCEDPGVNLDTLMRQINCNVHMKGDIFLAQKESNRVLEDELVLQQKLRRDTQLQILSCDEHISALKEYYDQLGVLLDKLGESKNYQKIDSAPSSGQNLCDDQ